MLAEVELVGLVMVSVMDIAGSVMVSVVDIVGDGGGLDEQRRKKEKKRWADSFKLTVIC